ncbi:hypothetical protein [Nocardioides yefusunii]|uniref:Uncharacterized protein n=1 Tax=Nocardioides yefusunii TaxID=2500546 RepID=A0ABW1QYN0_9ACTN|nr:hypothetical protein [Nocardioides yefusunii]
MTADASPADVPTAPEPDERTWTVVHGWVHPFGDDVVNLPALTAWLRGRAIAAVSATAPGPGDAATLALLVSDDADALVAVQGVDGPEPSLELQAFAEQVVEAFDVSITVEHAWASSRDDEDGEEAEETVEESDATAEDVDEEDEGWVLEHPLVIVTRHAESMLPVLARDLDAKLTATHADGWTIALAERDFVFLEHHSWLRSDLPAAAIGRSGERRYVAVMAEPGQPQEFGLVRYDDLIPVLDPIGLDPDLADALLNPHLAMGSAVRLLCETKPFRAIDPYELAAVVQSPMDDRWSSRVLATLGLPLEAAEYAEERLALPEDAAVIEARGIVGAMGEMISRYYDAPAHEVRGRTFYGKGYAAATKSPVRVGVTVAAEALATVAALKAATSARGWKAKAWRTLAGLLITDVATHAVLAPKKFRQP